MSKLISDEQFNQALQSINERYKDHPEYQINHLDIADDGIVCVVRSYSPHHQANIYDLALELGNGFYVNYFNDSNSSGVRFMKNE